MFGGAGQAHFGIARFFFMGHFIIDGFDFSVDQGRSSLVIHDLTFDLKLVGDEDVPGLVRLAHDVHHARVGLEVEIEIRLRAALVQDGELPPHLAVSVDDVIASAGLDEPVTEKSEVHFVPPLGGG